MVDTVSSLPAILVAFPIYTLPPIPTPPATTNAPVIVDDATVEVDTVTLGADNILFVTLYLISD